MGRENTNEEEPQYRRGPGPEGTMACGRAWARPWEGEWDIAAALEFPLPRKLQLP